MKTGLCTQTEKIHRLKQYYSSSAPYAYFTNGHNASIVIRYRQHLVKCGPRGERRCSVTSVAWLDPEVPVHKAVPRQVDATNGGDQMSAGDVFPIVRENHGPHRSVMTSDCHIALTGTLGLVVYRGQSTVTDVLQKWDQQLSVGSSTYRARRRHLVTGRSQVADPCNNL